MSKPLPIGTYAIWRVLVRVEPSVLEFERVGQVKSFKMRFETQMD